MKWIGIPIAISKESDEGEDDESDSPCNHHVCTRSEPCSFMHIQLFIINVKITTL